MSLIYTCINHILHRFVCMTVKCIICMHLDKIEANNEQAMSYWFDPHNKTAHYYNLWSESHHNIGNRPSSSRNLVTFIKRKWFIAAWKLTVLSRLILKPVVVFYNNTKSQQSAHSVVYIGKSPDVFTGRLNILPKWPVSERRQGEAW